MSHSYTYLMRHPQTCANIEGIIDDASGGKITPEGKWQVAQVCRAFESVRCKKIISSDAARCHPLADALSVQLDIPVQYTTLLREREPGELQGSSVGNFSQLMPQQRPTNGESVHDVYGRVQHFLTHHDVADSIIVSHGFTIRVLGSLLTGHPLEDLGIKNTGVHVIESTVGGEHSLIGKNLHEHTDGYIRRIHIFGPYASGKTTLAQSLSEKMNVPVYSLDDLKYIRKFDLLAPVDDRLQRLRDITASRRWITEGAWTDYAQSAFTSADALVWMLPDPLLNIAYAYSRQSQRQARGSPYKDDGTTRFRELLDRIQSYHEQDANYQWHASLVEDRRCFTFTCPDHTQSLLEHPTFADYAESVRHLDKSYTQISTMTS